MFYLVTGTVTSAAGDTASHSWLVEGWPTASPDRYAAGVLAHCNRDHEHAKWTWTETPSVEPLPGYELPPSTWFLDVRETQHDQLAYLGAPPGAGSESVLNIFVRPNHEEEGVEGISPCKVVLDMEGPLTNPLPVEAATPTATARAGLTVLMRQCGTWIAQLGQLMDTVALEAPTRQERAHERAVLDEIAQIVANRRRALQALEQAEMPVRPERVLIVGDDDSGTTIAEGIAEQLRSRYGMRRAEAFQLSANLHPQACIQQLKATPSDVIVFVMYDSRQGDRIESRIVVHPIFDALLHNRQALVPARVVLLGPISAANGVSRQHCAVLDAVILGNSLSQHTQLERLIALLDEWAEDIKARERAI